jgi:hypothetical protein
VAILTGNAGRAHGETTGTEEAGIDRGRAGADAPLSIAGEPAQMCPGIGR